MKKKHTIVIAVIILALVAVVLIFTALRTKLTTGPKDDTDTVDVVDDTDTDTDDNGTDSTVPMQKYTDTAHDFSFLYPTSTAVETNNDLSWRNNVSTAGTGLALVNIPSSFQAGTNLASSRFTVGMSSDGDALFDCLIATNGESAAGVLTINGQPFNKFTLGDAGAGNYYETTSYRTIRGDSCLAVEYTIHSTSLGAYDPGTVKAFDKAKITAMFEKMARSFTFLSQ